MSRVAFRVFPAGAYFNGKQAQFIFVAIQNLNSMPLTCQAWATFKGSARAVP
jgi:hypothetical protein